MIEVQHTLSAPSEWYAQLHRFLPTRIAPNMLIIEKELGEGFLEYRELQDGLWTQQIQVKLREDVLLYRHSQPNNTIFVIDFYLFDSEITREINGKKYSLGFENINLVLTSSASSAKLHIPAHQQISIFNIVFTKEWLFENVMIDHQNARDFFDNDNPIYISEDLDQKLKFLLKKINFQDNKLSTLSHVVQIIDYLFVRTKERELVNNNTPPSHIHPDDLNRLLEIKTYLDENINDEISLDMLAKKAGMSLSKFKRNFKQLFGTTPYQYHLSNKMEKSMEALQQQKYSVSEIGYFMGYSNLSQFSKAFRNHFGILPSEVKTDLT